MSSVLSSFSIFYVFDANVNVIFKLNKSMAKGKVNVNKLHWTLLLNACYVKRSLTGKRCCKSSLPPLCTSASYKYIYNTPENMLKKEVIPIY